MNSLRACEIRGTWATLLLPIGSNDEVDLSRLGDEIDYLTGTAVDGIYSNGTAGEFYTQSECEFDRIHALLGEKCSTARKPFQIGASHPSPQVSIERLRRARQLRPSAFQVILPDWVPVSFEEARVFMERMAEAADPVGLVLYNPPHAKVRLTPAEFGELNRAVPSLVGIKVAGGDDAWYREMRACAPGLSVFVPGHMLATGIASGAHGAYSNVACLQPAGAKRWNDIIDQDLPRAIAIEHRIRCFMDECIVPFRTEHGVSNQALDKLLAAIGNWCDIGTRLRWPYRSIPEAEAERLRPIARERLPELFE